MNKVVLVDKKNRKLGEMEKLEAHKKGLLHRAFSIFTYNSKGELLIQQRPKEKYHSGGLWSNTVCSHPKPGERYLAAAHRRLREEMGFDCLLQKRDVLIYKKEFNNGLTENEYDCIFDGKFDGDPKPNAKEIASYKWVSMSDLKKDIAKNPQAYTYWFKEILENKELKSKLAS